jgi:hypothetical protein
MMVAATTQTSEVRWSNCRERHMKCHLLLLFALGLFSCACAQEALIPLDSAGKLDRITLDDERKLGLFTDHPGFREARLFQISDSAYVLEIEFQPQSQLLKERRPFTADSVLAFRSRVMAQIRAFAPRLSLNQEGRAKFITGTTLLSLLYYGWAVPAMFQIPDGTTAVATYFLIGGAGYFIPYMATKYYSVTDGMAALSWYGGTRGIADGILLDQLIAGPKASGRDRLASGVVVSIAEMAALFHEAEGANLSPGTVAVIGTGGDWGYALGCGAAQLGRFFEGHGESRAAATILLFHGAGLAAGRIAAYDHPYTKGDARVLESAMILGGGVFATAADVLGSRNGDVFLVTAMVGSATGFELGHFLTRDTRFSDGQGSLIALGELTGALTGTGIAYVIRGGKGDERVYTGLAAFGGAAGFWLGYKAFAPHAPRKVSSWDLRVAPQPMISSASAAAPRLIPGIGARVSF